MNHDMMLTKMFLSPAAQNGCASETKFSKLQPQDISSQDDDLRLGLNISLAANRQDFFFDTIDPM